MQCVSMSICLQICRITVVHAVNVDVDQHQHNDNNMARQRSK